MEESLTPVDNLLYVSRATLPAHTDGDRLAEILAIARARNRALGVTGALIFTGDNFAQLLEGPRRSIDEIMIDIQQDPRHSNVSIVRDENGVGRRFQGWDMAYAGSSIFIARHVRVLAASFSTPSDSHIARLMELMVSLSAHPSS
jgi:hypothetical protein